MFKHLTQSIAALEISAPTKDFSKELEFEMQILDSGTAFNGTVITRVNVHLEGSKWVTMIFYVRDGIELSLPLEDFISTYLRGTDE